MFLENNNFVQITCRFIRLGYKQRWFKTTRRDDKGINSTHILFSITTICEYGRLHLQSVSVWGERHNMHPRSVRVHGGKIERGDWKLSLIFNNNNRSLNSSYAWVSFALVRFFHYRTSFYFYFNVYFFAEDSVLYLQLIIYFC